MKTKLFKAFYSIMIVFSMIMINLSTPIFASETTDYSTDSTFMMIEPRYVASCPSGGRHVMCSVAVAMMFKGNDLSNLGMSNLLCRGTASKCSYCDMMAFTQYFPGQIIKMLGYATFAANCYSIGASVYQVHGPYDYYDNLVSDPFIAGFTW